MPGATEHSASVTERDLVAGVDLNSAAGNQRGPHRIRRHGSRFRARTLYQSIALRHVTLITESEQKDRAMCFLLNGLFSSGGHRHDAAVDRHLSKIDPVSSRQVLVGDDRVAFGVSNRRVTNLGAAPEHVRARASRQSLPRTFVS